MSSVLLLVLGRRAIMLAMAHQDVAPHTGGHLGVAMIVMIVTDPRSPTAGQRIVNGCFLDPMTKVYEAKIFIAIGTFKKPVGLHVNPLEC